MASVYSRYATHPYIFDSAGYMVVKKTVGGKIKKTEKSKPAERRGRKVMGLRLYKYN